MAATTPRISLRRLLERGGFCGGWYVVVGTSVVVAVVSVAAPLVSLAW
jgi:hypothetical protein